jgi:O-antigen/teichoic acid export membrane protein
MVMVAFNIVLLVVLLKFFEIYGVLASLIITEVITALLYAVVIKKKLFRLN